MGHLEHKAQSPAVANCYILTISDTRTEAPNERRAIFDPVRRAPELARIVRKEPDQVRPLGRNSRDAGGDTTGVPITSRDTTFEAIGAPEAAPRGELFRMLPTGDRPAAAEPRLSSARGRVSPPARRTPRLAMTKLLPGSFICQRLAR
jgi:hypothetical protein